MANLKPGDTVQMKCGGEAAVLEEFGTGGQGTVYRVSYQGKEYALKWYHQDVFKGREKEFYKNLENNIEQGAPTDAFLWPLGITSVTADGRFGYIMELRPQGFHELTEFFVESKDQKQVHFRSFHAVSEAAIQIIQAFRELHNRGYSYQDINNGNFFIHPETGKVLICDNDNVSPYGVNLGVLGKQRYMAPEIVLMQNNPDKQSDRFSLAVILFRLLFINHPLEGRYATPPCMTKELERKYYGQEPFFVFDPSDNRNRPVPGTDKNLQLFWKVYPDYIKEAFTRAFSQDVLHRRAPRVIEKEWLDLFMRLQAGIVKCPHCGEETFLTAQGDNLCIECGKKLTVSHAVQFHAVTLPLFAGVRLMLWHVDSSLDDLITPVAETVVNPNDNHLLGLRNLSGLTWKVTLPDGSVKSLAPGRIMPVRSGCQLQCTGNARDSGRIV